MSESIKHSISPKENKQSVSVIESNKSTHSFSGNARISGLLNAQNI
jgi:hypothetical protein